MSHWGILIIIAALVIGFIMTWGVGANDLANIMSTTLGSKSMSVKQGIVLAVIFEFAGAVLGGSHVTQTIRTGIINTNLLANQPDVLMLAMISTLVAGAVWMLFASYLGMPVSITNTIVGALVGFGAIVLGVHAVHWGTVGAIAVSWVCSPVIAGVLAYVIFLTIKRSVFDTKNPAKIVHKRVPIYFFIVGIVLGNMTVLKGLAHFGYQLHGALCVLVTLVTAAIVTVVGVYFTRRIEKPGKVKLFKQYEYVEKVFAVLMAFTACAMLFAHGSNDVAIAMGPVSAVISLVHHGVMTQKFPTWVPWFGCLGVLIGLITYGKKVIQTVGSNITDLTPSRAFAATLAGASTVIVSTSTGIPVSATQTLVGGVLGVGLARGISALNLTVIRNIFMSWIITIPAAAAIDIGCYYLLQAIFGV